MSQYDTRIYVKVKNEKDWEKLNDLNFWDYNLADDFLDYVSGKQFYISSGDWSCNETDLDDLIAKIVERIPNCFILADTHDYNVDPYNYCSYYINNLKDSIYIDGDETWEIELTDIYDWCSAHNIELSDDDKEFIENF